MVEHEEHDEHGREFDQESDFTKDISEMIVTDEAMETMMERMIQSFNEKMDKAMAKHADENKRMMEKTAQEKDREEQCEKRNEWVMEAAKAILEELGVSCDRI